MKRLLLPLLISLAPLAVALAEDPPAESRAAAPGRVLWQSPEPVINLQVEEKPSSVTLELPALATQSHPVVLRFRARFQWPTAGGFAPNLGISVNGRELGPESGPVVNRDRIELTTERTLPTQGNGWWMRKKGWSLVLHYSPSPEVLEPRIVSDTQEGQWYLVQIDGVINTGGTNQLVFTNHAVRSDWKKNNLRDATGIVIEYLSVVELENLP